MFITFGTVNHSRKVVPLPDHGVYVATPLRLTLRVHRQDQLAPEGGAAPGPAVCQRRPAQLRVSALESDPTDSETDPAHCARLVPAGYGDWRWMDDGEGPSGRLDSPQADGECERVMSGGLDQTELELGRRRAAS